MQRNGIIVYSYEDVKKLCPESGTKGLWCFQANFHAGHQKCAEAAQHCDCVVGVMFNHRDEEERWMCGDTTLQKFPIYQSDIAALQKYSDICFILTGDYHPYRQHWDKIQEEFEEHFPIECLKEKGILDDRASYNALLQSVAFRYMMHGVYGIHFDYQAQGGKDRYRVVGYIDYLLDRWDLPIDLIDSIRDEYGNSISRTIGGLPQYLKDRINKPLLLPEFNNIEQVIEHIYTIEGLKVLNFYKTNGWVHATFMFNNYKSWTEGIRCT